MVLCFCVGLAGVISNSEIATAQAKLNTQDSNTILRYKQSQSYPARPTCCCPAFGS